MKTGILTFHNALNYGAVLQLYALRGFLSSLGCDCEVINYRNQRIERSYRSCSPLKRRRFESFRKKHFSFSPLYRSLEELQNAALPYDTIVAGSDQIWNSSILGGLNSAYFCDFGSPSARRIIYAASLGTGELNDTDRFLLQHYLGYPDFLSVREASMLSLLGPLTEKALVTVPDPVFLLPPDEYRSLACASPSQAPYIYLHYVHHNGENPALEEAARCICRHTGLPVLKNRSKTVFSEELPSCEDNGPEEFLGTLLNASYIVTDSFHATVFSLLFRKRFLTVEPVKRPGRLVELLTRLSLRAHLYRPDFSPESIDAPPFSECELEQLLTDSRNEARRYLTRALHHDSGTYLKNYFQSANPFRCFGCGACSSLVPRQADALKPDREGFLYPSLNSNTLQEPPCFLFHEAFAACRKATDTNSYLGYHKDLYHRMISADAGFFYAFCESFIKKGGTVLGKVYDPALKCCCYRCAREPEDCIPFLAFRPEEANPSVLHLLIRTLPKEAELLVLATPCHIAGLKQVFPEEMCRITTVEFACDGVYSPLAGECYLNSLSGTDHAITDYNLISKHYGLCNSRAEFTLDNHSLLTRFNSDCALLKAYRSHAVQRPSCYNCSFRLPEVSNSADITISALPKTAKKDFAPEDQSLSVVHIHSEKGQSLWNTCSEQFCYQPLGSDCPAGTGPGAKQNVKAGRPAFYQQLRGNDPEKCFAPFLKK